MEKSSIIYAEVFEFLGYMDKQTVMLIPIEMLEFLKEQRDPNYISKIDPDDLFNKDNMSQEAIDLLAWFDLKYFAKGEEKEEKIKIYKANDKKQELEKRKKYNPDNLFMNGNDSTNASNLMVKYHEPNLFQKLIKKIKSFFKI